MHKNIYNYDLIVILVILSTLATFASLSILGVGMVFLSAPFILHEIYGLKPGDVGYISPRVDPNTGAHNTPYQDFIVNGCLAAPFDGTNPTITLDTKGLEELGIPYYDPNTCFDIAKNTPGYIIDKVETYKNTTEGPFGIEKDLYENNTGEKALDTFENRILLHLKDCVGARTTWNNLKYSLENEMGITVDSNLLHLSNFILTL